MFNRNKKVFKNFDWVLLLTCLFLCGIGLIAIRSSTYRMSTGIGPLFAQIMATVFGFILIPIIQHIDIDYLKKLAWPVFTIVLILLLATLAFGFGAEQWGANSWLKLGPVTFQPSEFSKFGVIIFLAFILDKYQIEINKPKTLLILAISMGIPIFLILRQPDLGTAAVLLFFMAMMIFYAGISWKYIAFAAIVALLLIPLIYTRLSDIQKLRILNFIDPSRDPRGSNYQSLQGIIAIGSGKLTGRGFLKGTQTQYGFIPEQQTDYIFTALVEEFGFIGGCLLILSYALMLYRMIIIAYRANSPFQSFLVIGIAAMIFVHIFENIGMTMGLMPVTGIPLPLISKGGTFQVLNLMSIGLVLSVGCQRKTLEFT